VFSPTTYDWTDKRVAYGALVRDLTHLLGDERDLVANAAQTAALVWHALPDLNWAGFYFFDGRELVVGPFQGLPACTRIALTRGVCGAAASQRASIVVADVHAFPGHIACDSRSRSELVVPMVTADGLLRGVFDLDSPTPARFDDADRAGVERLVEAFASVTAWPPAPA
jgi:GAF domain-containing protein